MTTLVLGYGNPGRQDDGLGPALAEAVAQWAFPNVRVLDNYQLNIEDAAELAQVETAVFADAACTGESAFVWQVLRPAPKIAFTTHALAPQSLLALCQDLYQRIPRAFLLAVRGYQFGFGDDLSRLAQQNLKRALAFLLPLLRQPVQQWPDFFGPSTHQRTDAACGQSSSRSHFGE